MPTDFELCTTLGPKIVAPAAARQTGEKLFERNGQINTKVPSLSVQQMQCVSRARSYYQETTSRQVGFTRLLGEVDSLKVIKIR